MTADQWALHFENELPPSLADALDPDQVAALRKAVSACVAAAVGETVEHCAKDVSRVLSRQIYPQAGLVGLILDHKPDPEATELVEPVLQHP